VAECVAVNVQYSDAPDVIQDVEFDAAASCVDRPTKGAQQPVETGVVVFQQPVQSAIQPVQSSYSQYSPYSQYGPSTASTVLIQPVETGVVVVLQQVKFSLERDVLVGRLSLAGHRVVEEDGHAGETLERRM